MKKKIRIRILFVLFIFSILNFIIFFNTLEKLDRIKQDITMIQEIENLHFGKKKLNPIRDSLKATYKLDKYKNLLFKTNTVETEEIVILRGFLNDLFNAYIINFQQQSSIYWFLKDLESEEGLKFAENVYLKFDIENTKYYQSLLIEFNKPTKDVFDVIYKFPDDVYEVISNSKRLYYAKKKDGDIYWNDLMSKYKNKSEEDFLRTFHRNSFTILEPIVQMLVVTTVSLTNVTDFIQKEVAKEKNNIIQKYESKKKSYFYILAILIFLQLLIVIIIFQKDYMVTFKDKNLIRNNKKRNVSIFFVSFLFFLSSIPLVYYLYYLELKQSEISSDIKSIDQNIKMYSHNEDLLYDYYDLIDKVDELHSEYAIKSETLTKSSKELFNYISNINTNFPKLLYNIWNISKKTNKMSEILYVDDVIENSPSSNLLFKYDKILSINGETITFDNFKDYVANTKEGEILKFKVLRKNKTIDVDITPKLVEFYNKSTNKKEKSKIVGIYFKPVSHDDFVILYNLFFLQDGINIEEIPNLYEILERSMDPKIDTADYILELNQEIFNVIMMTNTGKNDLEATKADEISLQDKISRQKSILLVVISILDILGTFFLYLFIRIEGVIKKLKV